MKKILPVLGAVLLFGLIFKKCVFDKELKLEPISNTNISISNLELKKEAMRSAYIVTGEVKNISKKTIKYLSLNGLFLNGTDTLGNAIGGTGNDIEPNETQVFKIETIIVDAKPIHIIVSQAQ